MGNLEFAYRFAFEKEFVLVNALETAQFAPRGMFRDGPPPLSSRLGF